MLHPNAPIEFPCYMIAGVALIFTYKNVYRKRTNFRGLNFRGDYFSWVESPTVITVANSSCVQVFVGLIFVGTLAHEN